MVKHIVGHASTAGLCTALVLKGSIAAGASPEDAYYDFDIPQQDLHAALQTVALATNHRLLYRSQIVKGIVTPALKARLSVTQAVERLLAGTDLTYEITASSVVLVRRKDAALLPRLRRAVGLLLASAASGTAMGAAPSDDAGARATGLDEVVVTARRREESLQDVPVAVTAFNAAELESRSITNLQDVEQSVPNVQFASGSMALTGTAGTSLIFIRGVGQTDSISTNDPGVGVYVDGVYLGRMAALDMDTVDLEQVEILRGPQGTLFGKNTTGGAVNITTKQPQLGQVNGKLGVATGSFSRFDVNGNVNLPLGDTAAVRLSASHRGDDGYGKQILTGRKTGDQNDTSGRASLLWRATENLDVLLGVDVRSYSNNGAVWDVAFLNQTPALPVNLTTPDVPGAPFGPAYLTSSLYESYATAPVKDQGDILGTSLTLTSNLGFATFKSISAYRDTQVISSVDSDNTPYQDVDQTLTLKHHQASQEFQLNGTALGDRLNWTTGLYYFTEKATDIQATRVLTGLLPAGPNLSFIRTLHADNTSYAGYFQGTYAITDRLSFTGGARVFRDEKEADTRVNNLVGGAVRLPFQQREGKWDEVSPRLGFEYALTPDVLAYVSAAEGFKSGGANGRAQATPAGFNVFDPETVRTYELGIKTDLWDRRARVNAAVFQSDYSDMQVTIAKVLPDGTGATVVENAASATIRGAELELTLLPISGLKLSGSAGYLDAGYDFVDARSSLTGREAFPQVPEWKYSLSAEYVTSLGGILEATGRVDYGYQSEVYFDAPNSPRTFQDGYGLLNARVTLRTGDGSGNWTLALTGKNLTEEEYYQNLADFYNVLGFVTGLAGRPREWGLSLERRF